MEDLIFFDGPEELFDRKEWEIIDSIQEEDSFFYCNICKDEEGYFVYTSSCKEIQRTKNEKDAYRKGIELFIERCERYAELWRSIEELLTKV